MPDNENEQNPQTPNEHNKPSNHDESCYSVLSDKLKKQVPDSVTFGLFDSPAQKSKDEIVDRDNERAISAIIKTYTEHEVARLQRPKYLLLAIVLLTAGELVFFNYIIYFTITASFQSAQLETLNADVINNLFTILKYFIGATIVELIGMLWFITKGTYSSDHIKTMLSVLKNKVKIQHKKVK